MHSNRLILFTRFPEPGTTKTRLIPKLGPQGAADLQQRLTEQVVHHARQLVQRQKSELIIAYQGGTPKLMGDWLGSDLRYMPQRGQDIGERMHNAFAAGNLQPVERQVLIGSDIPDINAPLLEKAFRLLAVYPVVIGPTVDGGYYLIGLQRRSPVELLSLLFNDIPWSTSAVYQTTMDRLKEKRLSAAILPELQDIDRPDDLCFLTMKDAPWNRFSR